MGKEYWPKCGDADMAHSARKNVWVTGENCITVGLHVAQLSDLYYRN